MLLESVIKAYLEESKATKRTYKDDERYGAVWIEELGAMPLEAVTPADVEAWRRRKSQEATPATVNRHVAFLKRVYNVAIRDGRCRENPVARVKMLRENNARIRYLTPEEEASLQQKLSPALWPLVELALHTGLRQAEQFTMRWENVDFTNGVITIPRSKHGEKRHIPMNPRVRALLRQQDSRLKSEWVYPGPPAATKHGLGAGVETGYLTFSSLRKAFERALQEAEIDDFHWHDLRHTFASRLVMQGTDLRTVQELMGHRTILMTQRYSHLAPSHLQAAVDALCKRPENRTAPATAPRSKTAPARGRR